MNETRIGAYGPGVEAISEYGAAAQSWARAKTALLEADASVCRAEQAQLDARNAEAEAWRQLEGLAGRFPQPTAPPTAYPTKR